MPQIFRKEALERLSSPEQLDLLLQVTNPVAWISLLAMVVLAVITCVWAFLGSIPVTVHGQGVLINPGAMRPVLALQAGQVLEVAVRSNEMVQAGSVVARIQPLDALPTPARLDVVAPFPGEVRHIPIAPGEIVQAGDVVVNLSSADSHLQALFYLPVSDGRKVRPGMTARISPSTAPYEEFGYMLGQVTSVSHAPATEQEIFEKLGNPDLAKIFMSGSNPYQAAPIEIGVELEPDTSTPSGFRWSSRKGPNFRLASGTVCNVNIVTGTRRPIDLVVPYLDQVFKAGRW